LGDNEKEILYPQIQGVTLCLLAAPDSPVAHQTCLMRPNIAALTYDCALFTFTVDHCVVTPQVSISRYVGRFILISDAQ
jgi:phage baseplate assembly protein gpV